MNPTSSVSGVRFGTVYKIQRVSPKRPMATALERNRQSGVAGLVPADARLTDAKIGLEPSFHNQLRIEKRVLDAEGYRDPATSSGKYTLSTGRVGLFSWDNDLYAVTSTQRFEMDRYRGSALNAPYEIPSDVKAKWASMAQKTLKVALPSRDQLIHWNSGNPPKQYF